MQKLQKWYFFSLFLQALISLLPLMYDNNIIQKVVSCSQLATNTQANNHVDLKQLAN